MRFLRNLLTFLLLCGVLLVGMSFAVQNTVPVPLDLLFLQLAERSLALWVLLAFAVGGVIGMLTNIGLVLRLRASLMGANRRLRVAELPKATVSLPSAFALATSSFHSFSHGAAAAGFPPTNEGEMDRMATPTKNVRNRTNPRLSRNLVVIFIPSCSLALV